MSDKPTPGAEHHSVEAVVVFKRADHLKAEAIAIETNRFVEIVSSARDPQMS